jgi:glutamine synthetase
MTEQERPTRLPQTLKEAIGVFQASKLMKKSLGEDLHKLIVSLRTVEEEFCSKTSVEEQRLFLQKRY